MEKRWRGAQPDPKKQKKITFSLFFYRYFRVLISPGNMTVYLTPGRLEEDGQTQRGLWPRTPLMLC